MHGAKKREACSETAWKEGEKRIGVGLVWDRKRNIQPSHTSHSEIGLSGPKSKYRSKELLLSRSGIFLPNSLSMHMPTNAPRLNRDSNFDELPRGLIQGLSNRLELSF